MLSDKDSSNIKTLFLSDNNNYDNYLWKAIAISYEPRNNSELTTKRYVSNVIGILQENNSDTQQKTTLFHDKENNVFISAKDKDNYVQFMTKITL